MLTFIRGLPGSGKSTAAREMSADYRNVVHLETDMFWGESYDFDPQHLSIAHNWCQMEAARNLHIGNSIVVSNTFVSIGEFIPYLKLAVRFNSKIDLIECNGEFGSIHSVPDNAIERMKRKWEDIRLEKLVDIYEHIKYGGLF